MEVVDRAFETGFKFDGRLPVKYAFRKPNVGWRWRGAS